MEPAQEDIRRNELEAVRSDYSRQLKELQDENNALKAAYDDTADAERKQLFRDLEEQRRQLHDAEQQVEEAQKKVDEVQENFERDTEDIQRERDALSKRLTWVLDQLPATVLRLLATVARDPDPALILDHLDVQDLFYAIGVDPSAAFDPELIAALTSASDTPEVRSDETAMTGAIRPGTGRPRPLAHLRPFPTVVQQFMPTTGVLTGLDGVTGIICLGLDEDRWEKRVHDEVSDLVFLRDKVVYQRWADEQILIISPAMYNFLGRVMSTGGMALCMAAAITASWYANYPADPHSLTSLLPSIEDLATWYLQSNVMERFGLMRLMHVILQHHGSHIIQEVEDQGCVGVLTMVADTPAAAFQLLTTEFFERHHEMLVRGLEHTEDKSSRVAVGRDLYDDGVRIVLVTETLSGELLREILIITDASDIETLHIGFKSLIRREDSLILDLWNGSRLEVAYWSEIHDSIQDNYGQEMVEAMLATVDKSVEYYRRPILSRSNTLSKVLRTIHRR